MHKMYMHFDVEVDMEYHRQLNAPNKRLTQELVEQAVLEALQKANPGEQITAMDVKAIMPNHAIQR